MGLVQPAVPHDTTVVRLLPQPKAHTALIAYNSSSLALCFRELEPIAVTKPIACLADRVQDLPWQTSERGAINGVKGESDEKTARL